MTRGDRSSERASEAWDALRSTCLRRERDGSRSVLEGPGAGRAPLWPTSQVLAAAIDLVAPTGDLDQVDPLVAGLAAYRDDDGFAARTGPRLHRRRFFDDNAWIGLALVQLHLQSGRVEPLQDARRVLRFVATGQARPGGVRWREGADSLNACSTAPAAELALRLHLLDGDEGSLAFARTALEWIGGSLMLESGLVADRLEGDELVRTAWSYNQGATMGALALVHRATGELRALDDASALAGASLRRFRGEVLWSMPPVFNAIWFRNLLALDAIREVPGLFEALDAYLDRVWSTSRDPRTGLCTAAGIGSYDGTPAIDHAGIVQLLALRAWPPERRQDIC